MPKYQFTVESIITMTTEVEAENLEDAIQIVQDRDVQTLCHQCSRPDYEKEWRCSGDLDTDPICSPLVEVFVDGETISKNELNECRDLWDFRGDYEDDF